jgi:hypothetical protein
MKQIEGAKNYAIADSDYVFNTKTSRRMKRYWCHNRKSYNSRILSDSGKQEVLWHSDPHVGLQMAADAFAGFEVIPSFSDYLLAPHGAVWRVKGPRVKKPILMATHSRKRSEYVQLKSDAGKRTCLSVKKLVRELFEA